MSTASALPSKSKSAHPLSAPGLKFWEKALIAIACLLFAGSCYLYVADFPLRRYLFDLEDAGRRTVVGTLTVKKGALRRQLDGESEFKGLDQAEAVYDDDVIVTGPDGGATITMNDGSVLELGADTMVRLHYQTQITLGGISRAATIDVVAGAVKTFESPSVRPPRPTPIPLRLPQNKVELPRLAVIPKPVITVTPAAIHSPTPLIDPMLIDGVKLIAPRGGSRMSLPANASKLELPVAFSWSVSPPGRPVQLVLSKVASSGPGALRTPVFRQIVADKAGQGRAETWVTAPGLYEWGLLTANGKIIGDGRGTSARFVVEPEFEAIEPIDPLIGGKPMSSSRLSGSLLDKFDITLRWKPYPGASSYHITVQTGEDAKSPKLEREVASPNFLFSRGKIFAGQFFYQIKTALPSGFVARSVLKPFIFTFMAPSPVVPANKAVITEQALEEENDSVLMTWEKTNFTDWYELQIATDPQFESLVSTRRHRENFYIFKSPPAGHFYWRVRSSSKNLISAFSSAFELQIER